MRLLLTSSPCSPYPQTDGWTLYGYTRKNGFLEKLAQGWKPGYRCLMMASDPDDFAHNDKMRGEFEGLEDGAETLYGEAWEIRDGAMKPAGVTHSSPS